MGKIALCVVLLSAAPGLWAQGPPFQTDDPVPVDLHHYEFYIFGGVDGTTAEIDFDRPRPGVQLGRHSTRSTARHSAFRGVVAPSNNPIYLPGGIGPTAFGLTDMELGAKIAFIKESKYVPQLGTFTMFEIPTGNYAKGLGVGKVWYKVPVWLQKNVGHWTFDGGAGYQIVPQTGYRNFPYTGWLVKRTLSERLELGVEVFAHAREGYAAAQTEASTMIDLGGYYHFKHHDGEQFLFAYGHSIAGQTENYAYVGMYWTWGKGGQPNPALSWMQMNGSALGWR